MLPYVPDRSPNNTRFPEYMAEKARSRCTVAGYQCLDSNKTAALLQLPHG